MSHIFKHVILLDQPECVCALVWITRSPLQSRSWSWIAITMKKEIGDRKLFFLPVFHGNPSWLPVHCGTKPGYYERSNHSLFHEVGSEWASQQASRCEQMSEWCELTSGNPNSWLFWTTVQWISWSTGQSVRWHSSHFFLVTHPIHLCICFPRR